MAYYNIVPGSGNQYYAPQGVNYRQLSGGQNTGWQGGRYGYWDYRGVGTNAKFVPFGSQPMRTPLSVSNPAAWARQQLAQQTQQGIDDAKRLTEERYQEALGNLEGVGEQEGRDIDTAFDSSRSAVNQSLVSSGLSNTTVLPTMQMGVERERRGAQARLATSLARERNQLLASRQDIPPDLGLYTNLLYRSGAGGA